MHPKMVIGYTGYGKRTIAVNCCRVSSFSCIVYLLKPLRVFVYFKKIVYFRLYSCIFLKNKNFESLIFTFLILNQNFQVLWRLTVSSIRASYVTWSKCLSTAPELVGLKFQGSIFGSIHSIQFL